MRLLLLGIMLSLASFIYGQEPAVDTTNVFLQDTLVPTEDSIAPDPLQEHNPKRAVLYSLIVPGAGQVYNGQWWKVPIIYGTGYILYEAISFNTDSYKRFKKAYRYRVDGDEDTVDEFEGILSENAIKNRRDFYNKNRQLSLIGISFLYLLNALDAFVSGHLKSFDISDDLSLNMQNIESTGPVHVSQGISLSWKWGSANDTKPSLRISP